MVRIDVLGAFAATNEGTSVPFGARSAAAVVAFVALARGRCVSRDAAASALWPDHDAAGARTNLRKAIQRVRQALPEVEVLSMPGSDLSLNMAVAETDLDHADRLHRTYLLATRQPEGIAALSQEWALRRHTLLEGWSDEWIGPFRDRAILGANDLAETLARAHEAMGEMGAALEVWHEILERVPHHAQALQSALRLEHTLHGPDRAADLARSARIHFRDELGIEMPQELRRTLRDFGMGSLEPVPPPETLRKRSELYLLARMFESNLAANRTEALKLLAQECTVAKSLAHPRAMLSLLTLALEKTEGASLDRLQVAASAMAVASMTGEFEAGHRWADFILASSAPDGEMYASALGMKGFMLFEQRDYGGSRSALVRATGIFSAIGEGDGATRAAIRLAGLSWHLLDFEVAIDLYTGAYERCRDRTDPDGLALLCSACANLCFVYAATERWAEAVAYGRLALRHAEENPSYVWVALTPLGLSLFQQGERAEGARQLRRALGNTLREGMPRFNQIAIDFAAIVLAQAGRERAARCLLAANFDQRAVLRHARSPAEDRLVRTMTGFDLAAEVPGNPLRGQPAGTLSEWACEELDRLVAREEATGLGAEPHAVGGRAAL